MNPMPAIGTDELVASLLAYEPAKRKTAEAILLRADASSKDDVIVHLLRRSQLSKYSGDTRLQRISIFFIAYFMMEWGVLKYPDAVAVMLASGFVLFLLCKKRFDRYVYGLNIHKRISQIAGMLADTGDIRLIGPLCNSITDVTGHIQPDIEEALIGLLPRMRATDAHLLNDAQRDKLYSVLIIDNARAHSDLLVAILKALEQIGDERALPAVRELPVSAVTTSGGTRVRDAARACLPAIEQRLENERQRNLLLRPSLDPNPSAILLRPAANAPSDERVLLRSAEEPIPLDSRLSTLDSSGGPHAD